MVNITFINVFSSFKENFSFFYVKFLIIWKQILSIVSFYSKIVRSNYTIILINSKLQNLLTNCVFHPFVFHALINPTHKKYIIIVFFIENYNC